MMITKVDRRILLLIIAPVAATLLSIGLSAQETGCAFAPWEWCEFNPILGPRGMAWEAQRVFDPAAIVKDNKIYLLYRGEPSKGRNDSYSRAGIGLAVSDNGMDFQRRETPVFVASEPYELPGGCYYPRVVEFEGTYYMTYAGFGGNKFRLALATSKNLVDWKKYGLLFPGREYTKNAAIVPGKINGKYVMYFGEGKIWVAYSNDLLHWKAEEPPVVEPRANLKGCFDALSIEPGPPPVVTSKGIVLICNGLSKDRTISIGEVLFSKSDPRQVLGRTRDTCLTEPPVDCAANFRVDVKMYGEALVFFRGQWNLYFSYEDNYISLARSNKPQYF
jgi:predicted GH43/DUF377 family glycosyl hydrolase